MASVKLQTEGLIQLEQPLIKLPFEQLKRAARTSQKYIEKELTTLSNGVSDLANKATHGAVNSEDAYRTLDAMVERLQKLKRKLKETKQEEALYTSRTKQRLDHLEELADIQFMDTDAYQHWSKTRLDRMLVDYVLRNGCTATAEKLAKDANIESLVDIELFAQAKVIEDSLARHSCSEALAWCAENRSNLRKLKSTLEFQLRLQEFVELARSRRLAEAIDYARKHLATFSENHMVDIQQAMALLAFRSDTACDLYKKLYDSERWSQLVEQFRQDNYSLNSLTSVSLLEMTLQGGLAALRTPQCYQSDNQNMNCPVCAADTFGALAQKLPNAHHVNSCIVCRVTGDIMDEHNPPMVLPNGYVYSLQALQDIAAMHGGQIKCPRTGQLFTIDQARKAFIS
ncbi:CTLH/CRA C-terminal to lish motif domain-containing protein [Hyaloraphidium curvatum]|nr:CTLH/CRA C-terminal to lish motif domain-containing protein [Hyaloraphidium curvatum]